ncbi:MAG: hypothetical protein AB4352_16895 [Hormoscilla sp.]
MTERYAIRLTKAAEKTLYKLQPKQFKQVAKKNFSLQATPMPQDCKKLEGYEGSYRTKVSLEFFTQLTKVRWKFSG